MTPYQYAANNPIKNIDINGDSVTLGNLYDKYTEGEKKGQYKHEKQIRAFEAFAMTKAGRKYILDRAEKGFKLKGVYQKELSITAAANGTMHNKKIDVNFSVGLNGKDNRSGEISMDVVEGRLKLGVNLEERSYNGTKHEVFEDAESIGHEAFYHGDTYEKRFLKLPNAERTASNIRSTDDFWHRVPLNTTQWNYGSYYLQNVQRVLGYKRINTINYLHYNVLYPNLGIGRKLRPDIKF